jgi:hypothetical protein
MLIRLHCKAERSVVEIPRYRPSMMLWDFQEGLLAPKRRFDVMLDFTNDPVADEYFVKDSRAQRRLMVIDQVREIDLDTSEFRTAIRSVATEIAAAHGCVAAPANPTYRLGEDILFRQGGYAEGYKRAGWGGAERKFAWSCGAESHLVLAIVPGTIPSATAFRLVLRLRPFVVRKKHESQRLSISVNGHVVLHECVLPKLRKFSIPIPRTVLLAQDPVRIRFVHPDCRVPANLSPGSADFRELAFAFFFLAVTANPTAVDRLKRFRSLPVRLLHRMLGNSHKDP